MFQFKRTYVVYCLCFLLAASLSGCDLIASIKEYFQGPAEKPAAKAPATQQAAPTVNALKETPVAPNVLAKVGNWTITKEEFEDRLAALKEVVPDYDINDPQARQLVLDELINQQVLVAGAEGSGLTRQKGIQAAVEEFRRTLIVREVARQLTENITVTDEEARAFYDQNVEAKVGPAEWHVREIVVPTKEEATSILTEILTGADFAEMARQRSIGNTAAQGGDLGFITEEPFPQMGSALLPLEAGDVSSVFRGPQGYYIVKLEEKRDGTRISYEEIKEDIIESQMLFKQQQKILEHLDRLKETTPIEVNEQLL